MIPKKRLYVLSSSKRVFEDFRIKYSKKLNVELIYISSLKIIQGVREIKYISVGESYDRVDFYEILFHLRSINAIEVKLQIVIEPIL